MKAFLEEFTNKLSMNSMRDETIRQYVAYVRDFFTASNINLPSEITNALVEKYCATVFPGKKQATRNAIRASLSKVKEYYGLNFTLPKHRKAVTENPRLPIEPEEFKTLIQGVSRKHFYNYYTTKALIAFFYYTGLRESEVAKLKRSDIQDENTGVIKEVIMLFQDKNKSPRPIYINEKLNDLLKSYLIHEEPKSGRLFDMNPRRMRYIVNKAFETILRKKGFPHLLRHSFVTNCHREGVDLKIIQMAVGHSTIQQTEHYLKVNPMMVVQQLKDKVKPIDLCNV